MITIINNHNFKIDEENIKKAVTDTLQKNNFNEDVNIEVAIVNADEMQKLNKRYYSNDSKMHPVFTFINTDEFVLPPGTKKLLGQIVLNYDFTSDEKEIHNLIAHSTLHLLGIHH